MAHCTQVVLVRSPEYIAGIAAEALPGELDKPVLGRGNDVLHGNTGIVDAIFSAH